VRLWGGFCSPPHWRGNDFCLTSKVVGVYCETSGRFDRSVVVCQRLKACTSISHHKIETQTFVRVWIKFAEVCIRFCCSKYGMMKGEFLNLRRRTDLSESNWLCVDIRYGRRLFIIHHLVYTYTAVTGLIANGFCVLFSKNKAFIT